MDIIGQVIVLVLAAVAIATIPAILGLGASIWLDLLDRWRNRRR